MITEIQIENYKSIQTLKMNLGRVNVFIGENGCGKSNILEAIALASAAANNKLDNEYLVPRGIRVVEPQFMRSAFDKEKLIEPIKIIIQSGAIFNCVLNHDNKPYSKWENTYEIGPTQEEVIRFMEQNKLKKLPMEDVSAANDLISQIMQIGRGHYSQHVNLMRFLVYAPENTSLRKLEEEGQIEPLGIKGNGLLKLLQVLSKEENLEQISEIKERLELLDWFEDFEIPDGAFDSERNIKLKDRYLDEDIPWFDQRSANEGFLFLLFYFTLFISDYTPKFFAIDNIDASLNPKLCRRLIKDLVELAKKHDKQVIFTTHNPAILDGLNLDDDDQRLFAIHRNVSGHTKAKRILKPQPLEGQKSVKMSEAFMRGYIGGLPEGF